MDRPQDQGLKGLPPHHQTDGSHLPHGPGGRFNDLLCGVSCTHRAMMCCHAILLATPTPRHDGGSINAPGGQQPPPPTVHYSNRAVPASTLWWKSSVYGVTHTRSQHACCARRMLCPWNSRVFALSLPPTLQARKPRFGEYVTCPRSHSKQLARKDLNPGL